MTGDSADVGTVWRHKKTGHLYVVTGECQLEAEWVPAVLYVRLNGYNVRPIARAKAEFLDGRFEPFATPAPETA